LNQAVTREILWNVPPGFVVFLYGMLILLVGVFSYLGIRWYRIVRQAAETADSRFDQRRLFMAFRDSVGQNLVACETWDWMHYMLIVGLIGLSIGTSLVFVNNALRDFLAFMGVGLYFYYGDFYLIFKAAMDSFSLLLILGVTGVCIRRASAKPTLAANSEPGKLRGRWENSLGYWLPMTLLALLPLTGLMLEGARISVNPPHFTEWAYVGRNIASIEGALGAGPMFHRYLWLFHVLLVYGLLLCLPFTKLRYFIVTPLNTYFRGKDARA
jgi:hypothetical protein